MSVTPIVHQWQIYCNDESNWVQSWSLTAPTTCSNNTAHSVNSNSVQQLQSVSNQQVNVVNQYTDLLESPRSIQQLPIIDIKSFHGISKKDKTNTTGTGAITATSEVAPEIQLTVSAANDVSGTRSAKRGYYTAGLVSEVGVAIRIPTALDTAQTLKYGYYDNDNGYYFKLVGTTLNVGIMYNGTETLIARSAFNQNKLDGTEANGITLDFSKGNIFRIDFTWYGFGQILFGVIQTDVSNVQKLFPMHIYNVSGSTSCGNPHLPINVQLNANASTLTRSVYLAGRQYSILGTPSDYVYRNMYTVISGSSSNANINPLFTLKYRTNYITCPVEIKKIRATTNGNITLQAVKNATLTGSSFGTNTFVEESCLHVDTSATFTGGTVCKTYLLFGGILNDISIKDLEIYEDDTLTFTWQGLTTSNTINIQIEWDERW